MTASGSGFAHRPRSGAACAGAVVATDGRLALSAASTSVVTSSAGRRADHAAGVEHDARAAARDAPMVDHRLELGVDLLQDISAVALEGLLARCELALGVVLLLLERRGARLERGVGRACRRAR